MSPMEAARYNIYYFLTFFVPFLLMLPAGISRKKLIVGCVAIISIVATFYLDCNSIDMKWHTRMRIAQTEEEQRYAVGDGANRSFARIFIGPIEALIYTTIWGFVGWKLGAKIRKTRFAKH